MKQIYNLLIIICFSSTIYCQTTADTIIEAAINEIVELKLKGFIGKIQWQNSNDKIIWTDLTNCTNDTLNIITKSSKYYRAKVTLDSCPSYFSEITYIKPSNKTLISYDKSILKGNGYLVANGNSLTVTPSFHHFSDFIRLAKGDEIQIISFGNNQMHKTFGFVVCNCIYGANLELIRVLQSNDTVNNSFYHKTSAEERYIRLSCSELGLESFKFTITRTDTVYPPSTINALKRVGEIGESEILGSLSIKKVSSTDILLSNKQSNNLNPVTRSIVNVNFLFSSSDSVYKNYKVDRGVLQWVDNKSRMFFTANIGWDTKTGMCDRTIIFYSDDYCLSFKLLYDFKELMMRDFEIPCLMVTDAGTILFSKSEKSQTFSSLRPHSIWAIEGWKNGSINNLLDAEGNTILINRKFYLSYNTWIADRTDLDFAQYSQIYPNEGFTVGRTYAGGGRLQPGWSYNCYGNIAFMCEYGRGVSYWNYKNYLNSINKDGVYSISNQNNGLGIASKAWISLDGGATWKIIFDLHKKDEKERWIYCGDAERSHLHSINYNPYEKMFYILNGDDARGTDKPGYQTWMNPNQSINRISLAEVEKYYYSAPVVNPNVFPDLINTTNIPKWESIRLPSWTWEDYGYVYQLQFSTIEPFYYGNLFSTDCGKVDGFFRTISNTKLNYLDWNFDSRLSFNEKKQSSFLAIVHMGGGQQTLGNDYPRLLSLVPSINGGNTYIINLKDGNKFNIIYTDTLNEIGWGEMHFYTKNGIFIRPNNSSYNIIKLSNNTDFKNQ